MKDKREENKKPTDTELIEAKVEYDELGFVKDYVCSRCGAKLKFSHEDDVGTKFYKCEKCESVSSKLKTPEKRQLETTLSKPSILASIPLPNKKPSQADMLIILCLAQEPELFHDQHGTPYARVKQNNVNVTVPIRSRPFKTWLANLLWRAVQKAPGTEAVYGAINILEAIALYEGEKHVLYNRVAPAEDGVWIDMTDERWRAIKVTAEGWQIVDNPPILFKRYSHQKPLVEPKSGGDPWAFLIFANIDKKDKYTRLLLLCDVISYLIPMIPHVILLLYGIQGSGKTLLFKIIRRLIDPSAVEVLTLPRDERERVQQLDHHWCAFYDNVTHLPSWMSDTLCRAATGGGFTKRELYTNDSDIIYNFKRCVGLNGINIAAQRGDLLDRSLLVGLHDIPRYQRKTEEYLLGELEDRKAEILGGFLNTLAEAIRVYPSVNPKELFRMADFTKWGCAIAIALGHEQTDFINAYEAKVKAQIEEAAHASPLATVLMDYMGNHENWEGTPSELYKVLVSHAKDLDMSTRQKAWPKAPNVLIRQLNELVPSLKSLGWEVVTGLRVGQKGTRRIRINTVRTVSADSADDTDDISPISSREKGTIERYFAPSMTPLSFDALNLRDGPHQLVGEMYHTGLCYKCKQKSQIAWNFSDFKGQKHDLCNECGWAVSKELEKRVGGP